MNNMNFGGITPNFSVPPPPINLVNNGNISRPSMPTNQFPPFSGPMHNHRQGFSPFHQMMSPPPQLQQGQMNYNGNATVGNFNQNSRGRGFTQFSPNANNGNGRGYRSNPSSSIQPPRFQKQINYGSQDMFGTNLNNVNKHSFPQFNPHQQNTQEKFRPQNKSSPSQRGGGFSRGRGQRGSGGRGNFSNHNNSNNNQQHGGPAKKQKKEKIDKRDLPENNVFFCDICDRGFKTEEKYKEHVDGHQQCTFKDCPFVAAPKLVQLHMSMQHRGGLAKKIWSVESEEDIKKWREERKKNYPTSVNIQKKKEMQAERAQRGQVLETKDFSKMKRGRGGRRGGQGRGRRRYNQGRRGANGHQELSDDEEDDGPPVEMKIVRNTDQDGKGKTDLDHDSRADTPKTNGDVQPDSVKIQQEAEEKDASSLSLLTGYGTESADGDTSGSEEEEASHSKSHLENSLSSSLCENDKAANVDEKNKAGTSVQLLSVDEDAQTHIPMNSQQPSPVISPASSPEQIQSGNSSPGIHDIDPFNLNDKITGDLFHKKPEDAKDHLIQHASRQTMENGANIVEDASVPPASGGNEHSVVDLPIDDDEIFSEMDSSHGQSATCDDNLAKKSSDLLSSAGQQDRRRGTKRNHTMMSSPADGQWKSQGERRGERNNKTRRHNQRPRAKSYTLLEKLLAPEVRRERNKVLQCVHFIVKNNFFEDEQTPSTNV